MPDNNELFAIVPVEGNKSPPEAICVGPMSEVTAYIGQSIARIEEEERLAQAQLVAEETAKAQAETRACAAQMLVDGVAHLAERIDRFATNQKARADQLQREAEEAEAAAIEQMLAELPDPEAPQAMGDDGELEAIKQPPDVEKYDPEARAEALSGDMPEELKEGAPTETGEFGAPLPPESPYRNPVAIGGN